MKNQIEQLKRAKNAVILAHYYAPAEVQEIADYVGDSFYLAKIAKQTDADIIIFEIITDHFPHCCFLWTVCFSCHK